MEKGGEYVEDILVKYYSDNALKLRRLVKGILSNLMVTGLSDKDMHDFYSLANEVFAEVIKKYDSSKPFEAYLYSCLSNRIKTEVTKRCSKKRRADRISVSIDAPVSDNSSITLGETIRDSFDMEKEALSEEKEDTYSYKMLLYLDRLSDTQRDILLLSADGYMPEEIIKELNISRKQYRDCFAVIRSYRNISILF